MLDTLIIHIPLKDEFVSQTGNLYNVAGGDISLFQINASGSIWRDPETLEVRHGALKHPFEKVPSSYSNMAIKFYSENVANTKPYISLNASAKILQGHNVYGGESVKNLACEMIALLKDYYPIFFQFLSLEEASISRIDSTYSVRLPNEDLVQPALRFFSNVGNGHRKVDKRRDFYNTVYFGGVSSRYGGCKIYGKHHELLESMNSLQKKADRGCIDSQKKLKIYTSELIAFTKNLLRLESSTKKRKLEQLGLPVNLWEFIRHQENDRNVLQRLWRLWFDPILNSLKGEIMENYTDGDIHNMCKAKLWSQLTATPMKKLIKPHFSDYIYNGLSLGSFIMTNFDLAPSLRFKPFGTISYTKANNAFNFYQLLRMHGWDEIKSRYSTRSFNQNVKGLVDAVGIPRADLQNSKFFKDNNKSIKFSEIIDLDFTSQYPADYKPPVSTHIHDFNEYLQSKDEAPRLRLVS